MTRLAVSVEGQTEEEFVKQVLAEHLRERQVESTPIVQGRARGGPGGGNVSSDRLVAEMADRSEQAYRECDSEVQQDSSWRRVGWEDRFGRNPCTVPAIRCVVDPP